MTDVFVYRFYGTTDGGQRVLFGNVKAHGMGEAIELGAMILKGHGFFEYSRLEIERADLNLSGCAETDKE